LWNIDPLLGNDSETNKETTAIGRQQRRKYGTVLESFLDSGLPSTMEVLLVAVFFADSLRDYITRPTELMQ
jgi:hypothetical protein